MFIFPSLVFHACVFFMPLYIPIYYIEILRIFGMKGGKSISRQYAGQNLQATSECCRISSMSDIS